MKMPSQQATLGKFFSKKGAANSSPPQQSKLSFSTKSLQRPKVSEDEAITHGGRKSLESEDKGSNKERGESDISNRNANTRKRSRSRIPEEVKTELSGIEGQTMEENGDTDDEPILKRPRRVASKTKTKINASNPNPKQLAIENQKATATPAAQKGLKERPKQEDSNPVKEVLGKHEGLVSDESVSEADEDMEEDDEDGKPEAAAKARERIQTTLKTIDKDPYTDWKPGESVPYAALCTTFSLIEMTTKRLVIAAHCSLFLRQVLRLTPEDLLSTVLLMINKLAADFAGIELGIGESLIMKAIGETTGRSLQVIKQDQKEIGDLGLVAVKSRSKQPTMYKPKALTVRGVHKSLMDIATTQGNGAQGRKVDLIKKLLSAADVDMPGKVDITKDKGGASEAKFIVRFLEGKLRLGLAEKTVLISLAQAMVYHEEEQKCKESVPSTELVAKGEAALKSVYSELPSYDVIIPALLEHGIFNLRENCKLQPGIPLKPMLAKPTKSITEVLDRFENQNFTCEYKYDGERAQIHYISKDSGDQYPSVLPAKSTGNGLAAIFSRNSEDLSKKYPDIIAKLNTWVKSDTKSFVLDCETVAWDIVEKKVLPFQQLMTRKKKDVKIEDVKTKVCVFAFDLLFLNGEAVVQKSLRERRELMNAAFEPVEGEFGFAVFMNGQELDEIQAFLDESVKASCEGLMVKMLDGAESGYEPSKRSRNWLKIKKDYLSGTGDSLDLVVLGAYHGQGKRTSVYGAFLLACHNSNSDTYETVCKIGTGFSEAVLESLHEQLSAIVIDRPKPFYSHSSGNQHQPDVWFEPRYVWEVKTADLTLSPRYKAGCKEGVDPVGEKGISLRFPRFVRAREDKTPNIATTSRQVAEMYRKQESVTKSKGPAVDDDFEY